MNQERKPEPPTQRAAAGRTGLVRVSGDLATKARGTQTRFRRRLVENLRDALASASARGELRVTRSRLLLTDPSPQALAALSRVFGVQSVSLAERRPGRTLEEIVAEGCELFREAVRGRSFAVRARRVGERHDVPFLGSDIERALGAALLPFARRVDLGQPEVRVQVEIHEHNAYFLTETLRGPGGLPLGVEGRAVALLSGGFDSAVAAWQILRRGVALDYVFCNLGGDAHLRGVLRVAKVLADDWSYGERPRLHAVDFRPLARELQDGTRSHYWQVLLKRLMLRAAERVAQQSRAVAIVTGEALGQVSSQTLQNLAVISRATTLPILRPLVGTNKDEIIAGARRIGTHDLSEVVGEYCAMVSRRPSTSATLSRILAEEENLDLCAVERAVDERTVLDLRGLDPDCVAPSGLEVDSIPEGATLIDLRSKAAYDAWHWPGALRLDFARALEAHAHFSRDATYVLYCEFGLKSAHLAELMRERNLRGFHFRGGLKKLLRHAVERGHVAEALLGPVSPGD